MILIADGGSTSTDWRLIDTGQTFSMRCGGINPYFNSEEQISSELKKLNPPVPRSRIDEIFFYGAGLTGKEVKDIIGRTFRNSFGTGNVHLFDDLTAACRALFQDSSGIGCILGTGSNSGLYESGIIKKRIPPLGYILGDEGSGADIGIRFLNSLYRGNLPQMLTESLIHTENLERESVLAKIYTGRLPNTYLASLTRIIKKYIETPEIHTIISDAFSSFVDKMILPYYPDQDVKLGFVGSVAFHFQEILEDVVESYGLKTWKILPTPIDELAEYHRKLL